VDLGSLSGRRAAVIYNPVARALSRNRPLLESVPDTLASLGIEAHLVPTTAPGSAGVQARQEIVAGCDLIIAAGGDGTINEVIDGMLHSNVPLAILPGGTANVLARELNLPRHLTHAALQLASLKPCRIATGVLKVDGTPSRSFVCMTGAGLDAEIVYRLNLDLKAIAGKLAYYVGGFSQVLRPITEFRVNIDGRDFEAGFALVSRVRNYGGDLEIARGASLLNDDFEIVLFQGKVSVRYLGYLAAVAARQLHRAKGCTVLHGRSITFEPLANQEVYVQVDGELAGKLPASVEILPDALTLLVPPRYLVRERARFKVAAYA
jgi:diacylglycerol kinase (ATP)